MKKGGQFSLITLYVNNYHWIRGDSNPKYIFGTKNWKIQYLRISPNFAAKIQKLPLRTFSTIFSHCMKITQIVAFEFTILTFSTNFCLNKIDLSGNTASFRFWKTRKIDHFWHFWWTFVHSKCKISSLRSQY